MASTVLPTSARTALRVARVVVATTVPLSGHLSGRVFTFSPVLSMPVAAEPTDEELDAEDAEWDAVFARKADVLARMSAETQERVARGEAKPLDLNDL